MTKLIRKNDEHWKDNLIGLTFDKRLEKAILDRHTLENTLKRCDLQKDLVSRRLRGQKVQLMPYVMESVVCAVLKPKNRNFPSVGKIVDIGFNIPEDLILDNYCKILSALIRTPVNSDTSVTLKDTSNASRTFGCFEGQGGQSFNNSNAVGATTTAGTNLKVGSGSTTPVRTNYHIETSFGTAPESGLFGSGSGSYGAGVISLAAAISAGGSGTINETGFFGKFYLGIGGVTTYDIMLFHDVLDSGVAFVASETITVAYAINL